MIKLGAAILFVVGIGVFFWFNNSNQEEDVVPPNDDDDQIFILDGDQIVEVLEPTKSEKTATFKEVLEILPPARNKGERIIRGEKIYHKICIACHQPNGQGVPSVFPPLANSDFLNSDKQRAISIVANGLNEEIEVNGKTFHNLMPKPGLNDEEIANVLTFVYSQWGNSGKDVTPDEVKHIRKNGVKAR